MHPYYTGLGCNLQWHIDGEHGRGRTTHRLFGTQGSYSSFEGFPESRHAATTTESGTPSPTLHLLEMDNTTTVAYVNRRGGGGNQSPSVPTSLGTVIPPADSGLMGDSPSLTGGVECGSRRSLEGFQHAHRVDASEGCFSGHSTLLLCSGDRPICVGACTISCLFMCHDSQTPVLQQWMPFNRTGVRGRVSSTHQWCYCLEFSESEKRQSNRPTSSPRLARSTMVRSDSTDADGSTIAIRRRHCCLCLLTKREFTLCGGLSI